MSLNMFTLRVYILRIKRSLILPPCVNDYFLKLYHFILLLSLSKFFDHLKTIKTYVIQETAVDVSSSKDVWKLGRNKPERKYNPSWLPRPPDQGEKDKKGKIMKKKPILCDAAAS